jgi:simple sugar transport system ATP-binding protein
MEGTGLASAVRMENIVKRFPGVIASDQVNLDVEQGEIHALLGENGAGKTTLMNLLFGISQPDSGQIYLQGKPVRFSSPAEAIASGIGMVHQHFMLTPVFTVTENIMLVDRSPHEPFLDRDGVRRKILEISQMSGLHVDPDAKVNTLCVGDQQRVEIIKALFRGAKVIIMDEPTSVLTPKETDELFVVLRRLAMQGNAIIFITHKLREVMEISDRVTVLRGGRQIGTVATKDTNAGALARMMVGREVFLTFDKPPVQRGSTFLEVVNVSTTADQRCTSLKGVSLKVHGGEILGIAGVDGNGQNELAEVIMGLRPIKKGDIQIKEKSTRGRSIRQIIDMGVSNIPFLRQTEGLVMTFTVSEDLMLKEWRKPPITQHGLFNRQAIRSASERMIREYDIRTTGPEAKVGNMSGGNQQKVVLARELSRKPDVLIACHPTHGLDVGATEYVRQQLLNERSRGAAVLLISTELDEIFAISDKIAVFFEGEVMGVVDASEVNLDEIGMMMLGMNRKAIQKSKSQEIQPAVHSGHPLEERSHEE